MTCKHVAIGVLDTSFFFLIPNKDILMFDHICNFMRVFHIGHQNWNV